MGELPLPAHFDPSRVGELWRVPYEERVREAQAWAQEHAIEPAAGDPFRLCLLAVDVQNTFCIPEFELFVAGRSGTGAVDDNRRLCEFVYRNLGEITQVVASLDTHHTMQVFHAIWLVDDDGNHPAPFTLVSADDVVSGRWRVNPQVADALGLESDYAERHLAYYTGLLSDGGKYDLTIWPYHAMLGGIGHALVSAVEEALFFHGVARYSQPEFQVKGESALTEHYSILGPEVTEGPDGERLGDKNDALVRKLQRATAWPGRSTISSTTTSCGNGSRTGRTSSRTARRRSWYPESSTTPPKPTRRSSATPTPACTSSARPTRSRAGPAWVRARSGRCAG
jgi:nicotinamidase-related amidase